jgi:hypothetical protein
MEKRGGRSTSGTKNDVQKRRQRRRQREQRWKGLMTMEERMPGWDNPVVAVVVVAAVTLAVTAMTATAVVMRVVIMVMAIGVVMGE